LNKLADIPLLDDFVVEKLFNNCYLGSKTSVSEKNLYACQVY